MNTTFVLIEDNTVFLDLLRLFRAGGQRSRARRWGGPDGVDGLDLVNRLTPTGAIVDLRLPNLPGLALISLLRVRCPELAIVALTQSDSEAFREAARTAGADEFVVKEEMSAALLPAIERATAEHAIGDPS